MILCINIECEYQNLEKYFTKNISIYSSIKQVKYKETGMGEDNNVKWENDKSFRLFTK